MAKLALVVLLALSLYSAGDAASGDSKKVLCFYKNWTTYRPGQCGYMPNHEGVESKYCTHLVYYYADVDDTGSLISPDPYTDLEDNYGKGGYKKINALKNGNRDLTTILSVGSVKSNAALSKIAASRILRNQFATNLIYYLSNYGFDGVLLDWTFPSAADKDNLSALIEVLHDELGKANRVMGIAVPGYETQAVGFDVSALNLADFVVVDSYFYRDVWSYGVFHPSPLYKCEGDNYGAADIDNVAAAVGIYEKMGVKKEKIIVGAYGDGRSFALKEPRKGVKIGAPAAYGIYQRCTLEGGIVSYDESCDRSWESMQLDSCKATLRVKDDLVAAVESPESIAAKSEFAKNYGGIMLRNGMDGDDFDGSCGKEQELLSIMYKTLVES